MNLYFDIETIPTQRDELKEIVKEGVSPPGNISKPESIQKWMEEKAPAAADEKIHDTGFNGTFGEIVCIGYAFDDEDPQCLYRDLGEPESNVLNAFNDMLYDRIFLHPGKPESITWIGHYITGFDLRFIWNRMVINGIKPKVKIPYDVKPWADNVFDTCVEWAGLSKGSTSSKLDHICKAFGYEGKGDIDGSKVWDCVKAGKIVEVAEYCKDDANKARLLYKRMTFQ